MTKYLTMSEAQQKFLELPNELIDEPVIITTNGQPVMAAISYDQLTSLLETLDILADSEFTEKLRESMAQAVRGETVSWEEAKIKLGL